MLTSQESQAYFESRTYFGLKERHEKSTNLEKIEGFKQTVSLRRNLRYWAVPENLLCLWIPKIFNAAKSDVLQPRLW